MCGGTASIGERLGSRLGLSPRVRGNRQCNLRSRHPARSIPACAGEPRAARREQFEAEVYPRVCGGTYGICAISSVVQGLSPRVRGNLAVTGAFNRRNGSIPACAGEPNPISEVRPPVAVYPRVCGGTGGGLALGRRVGGLSPRVRGNRVPANPAPRPSRSIPACAGEPQSCAGWLRHSEVYPRVCGGTSLPHTARYSPSGLSPRVRGNHGS